MLFVITFFIKNLEFVLSLLVLLATTSVPELVRNNWENSRHYYNSKGMFIKIIEI